MNNHRVLTYYYLAVVALIALQASATVFELSKTIGYGQKMAYLQTKKQTLEQERNQLRLQQSQHISLVSFSTKMTDSYESIKKPIILSVDHNVALR